MTSQPPRTGPTATEPTGETHRALHILLQVAMARLGVRDLKATREEYEAAIAQAPAGLRLTYDGKTYRARRLKRQGTRRAPGGGT